MAIYNREDSRTVLPQLEKQIAELQDSIADAKADYIVEQGTDGIWTYRKWNSGIAECWGTYTGTVSYTSNSGACGGYRATIQSISFPFEFISSPSATATHNGNSTTYYGAVANVSTWATGLAIALDRGNSQSNVPISVTIFAKGTWK